jgi:hypothetical protein
VAEVVAFVALRHGAVVARDNDQGVVRDTQNLAFREHAADDAGADELHAAEEKTRGPRDAAERA